MYQRILVATDGSDLSQKAVESALSLAATLKAEVVALKVVLHFPTSYFEGASAASIMDTGRIELEWAEKAQQLLDTVKTAGAIRGVTVHTVVAHSDLVADTVIATAKKQHCDLIVMASHGRRGVGRLLLGSETQHVLTHSHIPVLVLR